MIHSFDEIRVGEKFPPSNSAELARQGEIKANRRLAEWDLSEYGLGRYGYFHLPDRFDLEARGRLGAVGLNYFNAVPAFFSDVLWGSPPVVETDNAMAGEWASAMLSLHTTLCWAAMRDSLRYGMGILTLDERNIVTLIEPDMHFSVEDMGMHLGDVFALPLGKEYVKIFKRPAMGAGSWAVHPVTNGGELKAAVADGALEALERSSAQNVHQLGESLFAPIRSSVIGIAAAMEGVQTSLDQNFHASLVTERGMVETDDDGTHSIGANRRVAGERRAVIEIERDMRPPEYLTLEQDVTAVEALIRLCEDSVTLATGLSRELLSSDAGRGQISGTALRRQMILLNGRLARYSEQTRVFILQFLAMLQEVTPGAPMIEAGDVRVSYPVLDALFSDEVSDDTASSDGLQ